MQPGLVDRRLLASGTSCLIARAGWMWAQFTATNGNLFGSLDAEGDSLAPNIHHRNDDAVANDYGFANPSLQDEHLAILLTAPPVIVSY